MGTACWWSPSCNKNGDQQTGALGTGLCRGSVLITDETDDKSGGRRAVAKAGGRWQAVLHPRPDELYLRLLLKTTRLPMANEQSRLRRGA